MTVALGNVRVPVVRPMAGAGGYRRIHAKPAFGSQPPKPEPEPAKKSPGRWLDRLGEYYEKLGVGGKILFFMTVPGASVVILFMERKRLMALFRSWKND